MRVFLRGVGEKEREDMASGGICTVVWRCACIDKRERKRGRSGEESLSFRDFCARRDREIMRSDRVGVVEIVLEFVVVRAIIENTECKVLLE